MLWLQWPARTWLRGVAESLRLQRRGACRLSSPKLPGSWSFGRMLTTSCRARVSSSHHATVDVLWASPGRAPSEPQRWSGRPREVSSWPRLLCGAPSDGRASLERLVHRGGRPSNPLCSGFRESGETKVACLSSAPSPPKGGLHRRRRRAPVLRCRQLSPSSSVSNHCKCLRVTYKNMRGAKRTVCNEEIVEKPVI